MSGVPASLDAWRGYVRRVVTEFKPYVKTWEVWNEPNLNDYLKEHPDEYVNDRVSSPNRFELTAKFVRFAARTRHEISQPISM